MKPVIFGLADHQLTADERAFFKDSVPVGYILFGRNIDNRAQLRALTDEMIDEGLVNAFASPSDRSISSFWNFGGATARVPADATAFGDRSFGWMYSLDSVWERAEEDEKVLDWTRNAWTRFRRLSHHGRLYLNFAGQDEDSAALTKDAFGRNFDRLAMIKHRYDPGNMFRFNQNIEPAGEF